jgi:hypothetical protein
MNNMNPTKKTRGGGTQVVANDKQSIPMAEMTHSYSINILSLQLTLLIEKMLPFETTVFDYSLTNVQSYKN